MVKKTKKLTIASLLTLAGLVGALGFSGITYAKEGGYGKVWDILTDDQKAQIEEMESQDQADREAHQAEMDQIFANRDYESWKEVIESKPKITDYVNEENFDRFAEMHELMESGDVEAAQEIRDELGLPDKGMEMGPMGGHSERHGEKLE